MNQNNQLTTQAVVVEKDAPTNGQGVLYLSLFNEDGTPFTGEGGGGGGSVSWDDVDNKPSVIAAGDNAEDARAAIGAGTSSLALGTSGSTAAAGNHTHAGGDIELTGYSSESAGSVSASDSVNSAIAKLEARIEELESAGD